MTHRKLQALSKPWMFLVHGKSWGCYLQTAPAAAGVKAARAQLIGCSVEHGNSDLWRLREMTSGEDREEEYRCRGVSSRATDSSVEASVMEVERCGGGVW